MALRGELADEISSEEETSEEPERETKNAQIPA